MSERSKKSSKKGSAKERELMNVQKCLRQRLAWCNKEGHSYDSGMEQYSIFPRALAKFDGLPHTGTKAHWTEKLRQRYPTVTSFPQSTAGAVIIDFMFFLYTNPQKGQTVSSYADTLLSRVLSNFSEVKEVHLIFDKKKHRQFQPQAL